MRKAYLESGAAPSIRTLGKASVDLFDLGREDFVDEVEDVITVGEFYGLAAGGQIVFT